MIKLILLSLCLVTITLAQTNYSNSKGLKYLHYAKASYCKEADILDWTCEACAYNPKISHRYVIQNSKFESLSFVGYNKEDNEIVVVFRGSDNFRNWLTNLNFVKKSYSGCRSCQVHGGFMNAWSGQSGLITNRVKTLLSANPNATVSVVGHSLGGAIATVASLEMRLAGIKISELITFGAPRVGNEELMDFIQSLIPHATRIVHRRDPVPHAPPRSFGFRNFGREHFYNNDYNTLSYETCAFFGAKSCSNDYHVVQTVLSVKDHLNYLGYPTQCSNIVLKSAQEEENELELIDMEDIFEGSLSQENVDHIIDLDDTEASLDWVVSVDDSSMDYLIFN